MAGKKKKTKPNANPARGFATTSLPSKPRIEVAEVASPIPPPTPQGPKSAATTITPGTTGAGKPSKATDSLSAEEYAKQLEQDELQLLVEKCAEKCRRDSKRQQTRLETERRLQRMQAEPLNVNRWLTADISTQIMELIRGESRYAQGSLTGTPSAIKQVLSEEDLTVRLWTLQQTLSAVGFPEARVSKAVNHVLSIYTTISAPPKDSIWGLDEAFEWLALECESDELPSYEAAGKRALPDSQEVLPVNDEDLQPPTQNLCAQNGSRSTARVAAVKKPITPFTGDIEPESLIPEYVLVKERLLRLSRQTGPDQQIDADGEIAVLNGKMEYIQKDPLFDRYDAEQAWKTRKAWVEKEIVAARKIEVEARRQAKAGTSQPSRPETAEQNDSAKAENPDVTKLDTDQKTDVNGEAERVAAEVLAEVAALDDEDDFIGGLFTSLPQQTANETAKPESDAQTTQESFLLIRDFGEVMGLTPRRVLEETCRLRDPQVKLFYSLISDVSYANRHEMLIIWSKPQAPLLQLKVPGIEAGVYGNKHYFKMVSIATPSSLQSESYISASALYLLLAGSGKTEKAWLRLSGVWREFWHELADSRQAELDKVDRDAVGEIRQMVRDKQELEMEEGVIEFQGRSGKKPQITVIQTTPQVEISPDESASLRQLWVQKASHPKFQRMLEFRRQLPMWGFKQQVLSAIEQHQVVIICGETGCGKSTQTPAFILEHQLSQGRQCKIYCTEPRRISALSLARRVSEELGENRGDVGTSRSLVGYAIRLESNVSKDTRLVYATTGIVMRMLEGSNDLAQVTHLVLDEVHERSIDSDFLLIVLKKLLPRRPDLKVVLMSATVDAGRFSQYLGGAPVLNVPGRTFPVEVRYLEDAIELTGHTVETGYPRQQALDDENDDDVLELEGSSDKQAGNLEYYSSKTKNTVYQFDEYRIDFDLIVKLLGKIASDPSLAPFSKAVLIFLPGIAEIRTLNDLILGNRDFTDWLVYPLHSTIATEDQEAAFLVPPKGKRKVVLATNIAETGITIPDVTCVIDSGKHREMRFNEKKQMSRLVDTFISQANAKQRRGRAGRVQPGLCYHLFTRYRHDKLMSEQQTPEILRLSLQELAIRVKTCNFGGIKEALSGALDCPAPKNIRRAIDALVEVRALTSSGSELTPLGHKLALLPVDVFLGKLILYGAIFKCLDMALSVAALLSVKSPFIAPFGERAKADRARLRFSRGESDLLTVYNAYLSWKNVCQTPGGKAYQFCQRNYLSVQTLSDIEDTKGQLLILLADSGFLPLTTEERRALAQLRYSGKRRGQVFFEVPMRVNVNSDNDMVCASVITWSFYPKLLTRDAVGGKGLRDIRNNQSISVHPSSVNKTNKEIMWLSYYNIMQSKTLYYAHETTAVDPFAIVILAGGARIDLFTGTITIDNGRARFSVADWKTMLILKVLRARLRKLLTHIFASSKGSATLSKQQERWFAVWQQIFDARNRTTLDVPERQEMTTSATIQFVR